MTRRRPLSGKPLLVASGLGLSVACGSHDPPPMGNLMPPPRVHTELCVDVFPPGAAVVVNKTPLPGRCIDLEAEPGEVATIEVIAAGMPLHTEQVVLTPPSQTVAITVPPKGPNLDLPPMGNLMPPPPPQPPPPPPPVGNLMPPPPPPPKKP